MKLACLVGWTKGPAALLHLGEGRGHRSAWGRRRSRVKEEGRRDSRAPELEQRRRRERSAAGKGRTPVASGERTDVERGSRGKSNYFLQQTNYFLQVQLFFTTDHLGKDSRCTRQAQAV